MCDIRVKQPRSSKTPRRHYFIPSSASSLTLFILSLWSYAPHTLAPLLSVSLSLCVINLHAQARTCGTRDINNWEACYFPLFCSSLAPSPIPCCLPAAPSQAPVKIMWNTSNSKVILRWDQVHALENESEVTGYKVKMLRSPLWEKWSELNRQTVMNEWGDEVQWNTDCNWVHWLHQYCVVCLFLLLVTFYVFTNGDSNVQHVDSTFPLFS